MEPQIQDRCQQCHLFSTRLLKRRLILILGGKNNKIRIRIEIMRYSLCELLPGITDFERYKSQCSAEANKNTNEVMNVV